MRKILLSAIVTAVAMGFFGSAVAEGIEGTHLTVWVNGDKSYKGIEKVGERFEKDTGIKVIVEHPEQPVIKFLQHAASGNGTDLFMWAHDRFGEWVQVGILTPVEPTPEEFDRFQSVAWEAMKVKDKYYGYPVSIEAIAFMCNKDLVPETPKTFEELVELDEKLQREGKHAIVWDYNDGYFTYPILSANGGYSFRKNENGEYDVTKTGINSPGAVKGLEYIVNLIRDEHMQTWEEFPKMEKKFIDGNVGCIINGAWGWERYSKLNYSVNPFPTLDGKPGKPFVGVWGMTINKASPNKEAAKKFLLDYLLTDEGLEEMNNDRPLGAVALKSYQAKLEKDPRIATIMYNVEHGDLMPNIPEMNKFWSSLQTALKNATTGRQSAKKALKIAEERVLKK